MPRQQYCGANSAGDSLWEGGNRGRCPSLRFSMGYAHRISGAKFFIHTPGAGDVLIAEKRGGEPKNRCPIARRSVLAFLAFFAVMACCGCQQHPSPTRITIRSTWDGIGHAESATVINRAGQIYRSDDGRPITPDAVQQFVAAVLEMPIPRLETGNLGLNAEMLSRISDASVREYASKYPGVLQGKNLTLFRAAFNDPVVVQEAVRTTWGQFGTDNWPVAIVSLVFADGQAITVGSSSQSFYMLPWMVTRRNHQSLTYNADISRALVRLIPPAFVNYRRIAGVGIESEIGDSVTRHNVRTLGLP